jgi:hypothetical protein
MGITLRSIFLKNCESLFLKGNNFKFVKLMNFEQLNYHFSMRGVIISRPQRLDDSF